MRSAAQMYDLTNSMLIICSHQENLEFHLVVETFKRHRPLGSNYRSVAQAIYDKYVRIGTQKQINISHRVKCSPKLNI